MTRIAPVHVLIPSVSSWLPRKHIYCRCRLAQNLWMGTSWTDTAENWNAHLWILDIKKKSVDSVKGNVRRSPKKSLGEVCDECDDKNRLGETRLNDQRFTILFYRASDCICLPRLFPFTETADIQLATLSAKLEKSINASAQNNHTNTVLLDS